MVRALRLTGENFVQAGDGGGSSLEQYEHPAGSDHGPGQKAQVSNEGRQRPNAQSAFDNQSSTKVEQDSAGGTGKKHNEGSEGGINLDVVQHGLAIGVVLLVESLDVALRLDVSSKCPNSAEAFSGLFGEIFQALLRSVVSTVDGTEAHDHKPRKNGERYQGISCELWRQTVHEYKGHRCYENAVEEGDDPESQSLPHGGDIIGGQRHELTVLRILGRRHRKAESLFQELASQIELDVASRAQDQVSPDLFGDVGYRGE